MAQTYHIYDWEELPPSKAAALAVGLPQDSRTKRKILKINYTTSELILAMIVDCLNILIWQNTKDGHRNRNHPDKLYKQLIGKDKNERDDLELFDSEEEFLNWHKSKMRKNDE